MKNVNRWHCHPLPELRNSGDNIVDHQARVLALAESLCAAIGMDMSPDLFRAFLHHDDPEFVIGDWPATLTRQYRVARWAKAYLEWRVMRKMGLKWKLTRREKLVLKICDTMDAYLWARAHVKVGPFHSLFHGDLILMYRYALRLDLRANDVNASKWVMGKLLT